MFDFVYSPAFLAVANALLPFIAAGIINLIIIGTKFLQTHINSINNASVRYALSNAVYEVERFAEVVVTSLNQTVVNDTKAANGGKLTPDQAAKIRNDAVAMLRSILSTEVKTLLEQHYGDIEKLLLTFIEASVASNKSVPTAKIS